ncbi:MAG TPA: methylmalonyl-CoA mutase subunit beta [Amycolatopsis sp.]|nr:methylmalonyl-CoA mutase subunit beta [Amycolatopsis sp.]
MTNTAGPESVPIPEPALALAAEFPAADRARWQELVAGVLRKSGRLPEDFAGAPESKLVTRTYDGIDIQPLYTAADAPGDLGFPGLAPFVRGARPEGVIGTGWDVRVRHDRADAKTANAAILADLEGGATSVWLRVGSAALPLDALADALNDVYVDLAPVILDAGADYEAAAEALLEVLAEREIPPSQARAGLGADPIGTGARTGEALPVGPAAELAVRIAAKYPKVRTLVADGLPFHEAGGSDIQELGAAIAVGVAYLRALTDAGLDLAAAAGQVEFRLAATADQFTTIAKFRAARRLWDRVLEVSGAPPSARGMHQHAVTSPAMLTQRDPWVNLLRTTVACFAAGVGGADAVTVLPFDSAIGEPDAFAARIARNTNAILLEESKLGSVIDPAGGSWYVERLTDELANAAWAEFTAIEAAGGVEAELASGAMAQRLAGTWDERAKRLATRRDPITGVSEFPNLAEQPVAREPRPSTVSASEGLPRHRYAEAYEKLRDASDAYLAKYGERPKVFLATLGPVAAHTTRAGFAANLFQAGGLETVNPGATDDLPGAFRESGARIACLCGTDSAYEEQAADVAAALGAETVLLAGKATYPGVSGNVYAGCDALEILTGLHAQLGVGA